MEFRKAEKRKAKLRLGITGAAGSGKTYGALLIAKGLGGKTVLLDTENGSEDLYAGMFDYDVGAIQAPYTIDKYIEGIQQAESLGYDIIIIDSLSHAWAGEGGLLEQIDTIAAGSRSGNTYTAWRQVTPQHNKLIEKMLNSTCHIIATMRSKTEYVIVENDKGRKEPRKVGLAPVQREGMDYEFGVVFDLGQNHMATVSKDRTSLFDGQVFTLSEQTGEKLRKWLENGIDLRQRQELISQLWTRYLNIYNGDKQQAWNVMREITHNKHEAIDFSEDEVQALIADIKNREDELKTTNTTQEANNADKTGQDN